MNRLLKRIILFSALFIAIIVILGLVLSNTYSVKHSIVIDKPLNEITPVTHDLNGYKLWAPWLKSTKTTDIIVTNPTQVGGTITWEQNSATGKITLSHLTQEKVAFDMFFDKDISGKSTLSFTPDANRTVVLWHMHGKIDIFLVGALLAKINQSMVGDVILKSLQNIKAQAEHNDTAH